jgi:YfiH family protein
VIGQPSISIGERLVETAPLPFDRSLLLSAIPAVAHGITRRVVDLEPAEGNVGYGVPRDRDAAWAMRRRWCDSIGLDAETLVTVHQIHGADAIVAKRSDAGRGAIPGSPPLAQADAIITNEPGVALMTLHADCLALLLCDPEVPAVAAIHAGWRGTIAGVTTRTVEAMVEAFDAQPDRMIAYLGATNRACCFEVGEEVIEGWLAVDPTDDAQSITRPGPKAHFDVAAANRWQLLRSGVQPAKIELSGICTSCSSNEWFSHRVQGHNTGRFGAIIGLR